MRKGFASQSSRDHEVSPKLWRCKKRVYYEMFLQGMFSSCRVELLDGVIWDMPSRSVVHCLAVEFVNEFLRKTFPTGYRHRVHMPLSLGKYSCPEPDVALIAGEPVKASDHPSTASVVVEVSEASIVLDRDLKARIYAFAQIPEYWIVNLVDRQIEVYRQPVSSRNVSGARYSSILTISGTGTFSPISAPEVTVAAEQLLPRATNAISQ